MPEERREKKKKTANVINQAVPVERAYKVFIMKFEYARSLVYIPTN